MTNEEAIEQIKVIPIDSRTSDKYMKRMYEALDMAIKALEQQEPCEAVTKKAVPRFVDIC